MHFFTEKLNSNFISNPTAISTREISKAELKSISGGMQSGCHFTIRPKPRKPFAIVMSCFANAFTNPCL